MKTIITGSSGFVGRNLTTYLEGNKIQAQGISLRSPRWAAEIDTTADALIHLAGKAHDTTNTSSAIEYFKVNRDLTISLFEKFLASDIRDFYFFSSVKAVADTVRDVLYEDLIPQAITPYGQSKLEAETYLLNQDLPEGKRLFIIRPCMIHGRGNKGNLNLLYKVVEKGLPWPLAAYDNQRSFLSIDNLTYLIHQMLLDEKVPSGIYHFADDEAISTNQLIQVISTELGKKPRLWKLRKDFIESVGKIGDVLPLPLNSERLKKLTESYVVSNQKIKNMLGINALPLTATEGLMKTIASFKES